ncbi:MAG: 4Fe-4S binding protein [bacterium]|nr:4Fe-4S binding protein [bacterium]
MMVFQSVEQLIARKKELEAIRNKVKRRIVVCAGTGCVAAGSLEVYDELTKQLKEANFEISTDLMSCAHRNGSTHFVSPSGCHGYCQMGPLLQVEPDDILYMQVKPKDVGGIIATLQGKQPPDTKLLYKDPHTGAIQKGRNEINFYAKQERIALKNCGFIDPESLEDYLANGGYNGLIKALSLSGKEIVDIVTKSGLRGRGGAGFSTGKKWQSALQAKAEPKYVLCNGDEGDPGAFMDRSIMEGDPFKVLEGMTIGAWALQSQRGYIYVRKEYPLAVKRLQKAINELEKAGLLGDNILGTGFSFKVTISRGGGAFVCGESTALMRSIEGKVGEPRAKYTRSVIKGLYDCPTVLNNVETWACVPLILENGWEWFASKGTKTSTGTKAFSLVGKVKNTGLVEVPMGTTLRQIIFDIGGGIIGDRPFKAVQTGGPSGGCLPEQLLDLPVDFDTLTANGSMMGSGGMIVMDCRNCMVDIAKYFVHFLLEESCGKCTPCREGLRQLHYLVTLVTEGKGDENTIKQIERVCHAMKEGSLCSLGKDAPNPVLSTLKYFREEWLQHIQEKKCVAGVCRALITYWINPEKCTGCLICGRACPQGAIIGEKQKPHRIDPAKCDKCGVCYTVCPERFSAVEIH